MPKWGGGGYEHEGKANDAEKCLSKESSQFIY